MLKPIIEKFGILNIPRIIRTMYWDFLYRYDRVCNNPRKKQVVICGYPRSGTSLLYNMLATCLPKFKRDHFEVYATERIHKYDNRITKSPMDIFNISDLHRLNKYGKQIYVIIVIRDLRDLTVSIHPNLPDQYFIGHDHSWWPQNKNFTNWEYNAPGIISISNEIENILSSDKYNVKLVRYEDLVMSTDNAQNELQEFLDEKLKGNFLEYHNSKNLPYKYEGKYKAQDSSYVMEDKPVVTARHGKWKEKKYTERITEQFEQCPELFNVLTKYKYEEDDKWFSELKNPD